MTGRRNADPLQEMGKEEPVVGVGQREECGGLARLYCVQVPATPTVPGRIWPETRRSWSLCCWACHSRLTARTQQKRRHPGSESEKTPTYPTWDDAVLAAVSGKWSGSFLVNRSTPASCTKHPHTSVAQPAGRLLRANITA